MMKLFLIAFFIYISIDTSLRELSKEFNIPKSVLHRHIAAATKGTQLKQKGRTTVFSNDEILELKNCVIDMAELGFAPTLSDIREIVTDYVNENNHLKGKEIFNYKGVSGSPGPDWIASFMKTSGLSLKNATKLSKARSNATKNPFIINHWYDLLEETIDKLGLGDRPDLIWNADESGLPSEPKRCKVISLKGQPTLQIVTGSDRENMTVLAAASASGKVLPPLIIFSGKQVQTTWRPQVNTGTEYPWIFANASGWMTTDTFFKWFVEWETSTRSTLEDGTIEPRIMIYDGHLSHVGYGTIIHARNHNVTILKLPPHTTDLLQPLDVSVFGSLKVKWGAALFKRLRKSRSALSKSEFSTLLVSDDVWKSSCTEETVQNGFKR